MNSNYWKNGIVALLGLLLVGTLQLSAKTHDRSPEERAKHRSARLTKILSLSAEQNEKLNALFSEEAKKIEELRAGKSADRKIKRAAMMQLHQDTEAQLKNILTTEQYAKYQEQMKISKDKRKARKGGRS